jgi:hypothetical protein
MDKNSKINRKEQYQANRKALIEISTFVRMSVKEGIYDSVNEGLHEIYTGKQNEIEEFNTFNQWKEKGYTVKKGSKAFLFWGQPRQVSQVPEGSTEPEEYKYWPICYLFSNCQVHKMELKPAEPQPEQEPQRQPVNVEDLEEALI